MHHVTLLKTYVTLRRCIDETYIWGRGVWDYIRMKVLGYLGILFLHFSNVRPINFKIVTPYSYYIATGSIPSDWPLLPNITPVYKRRRVTRIFLLIIARSAYISNICLFQVMEHAGHLPFYNESLK